MTDTALAQIPATAPAETQATAIEQARAVAEVAAAVKVAQDFPRDGQRAMAQMREACSQKALADRAFYSLPRAGGKVEGSTVHLARELARCWGNVDYGIRELRRDDERGVSEMQAWAWDQESNVRSSRSFVVPHARMARGQRQALTDLADIANNNNSVAARAVRETIFTVLPVWFRTDAETACMKALTDGGDKPIAQQVTEAIVYFTDAYPVTQEQLEERVGKPAAKWTARDLGGLRVLDGELVRGEKKAAEEFAADPVSANDITGEPDVPEINFDDEGAKA